MGSSRLYLPRLGLLSGLLAAPAVGAAATFSDVTASALPAYVQQVGNEDPASCRIAPVDPLPPELDPAEVAEWRCMPERFSGGAAVADVDGDGHVDLYVTRLDAHDLLFRNRGDGTFEDASAASGLASFALPSNGAVFADVDNDGDPDLYVTTLGDARHHLFINDGTGVFAEQGLARGAAVATGQQHAGFSVAVGDYDRDGWLDLFTSEWRMPGFLVPTAPSHARLLRNRGNPAPGFFEDRTAVAGVSLAGSLPLGGELSWAPAFADLDGDGWSDLAVVADGGTSRLFWNDADGTFTEGTVAAGVGTDENGMGSTFGDQDGDGDLDWFVSSIYCTVRPVACSGHRLYRNEGNRSFSDQTDAAGVRFGGPVGASFEVGWGSAFFDFDNDGDLDLVMTQGVQFVGPYGGTGPFPLRFWRNDGPGAMPEQAAAVGLTDDRHGKGLLVFDYDEDGDLDLFVVNNADAPVLYRNEGGNAKRWLRVRVRGTGSNAEGIGARVQVEASPGGPLQVREVGASTHFLGQSERVAHFGLGDLPGSVWKVRVTWPRTGVVQEQSQVAPDQVLEFVEPPACDDGVDNDGDGAVDFGDDPGCQAPGSLREDPQCDDGIDNDGDGGSDWDGSPPDPQCTVSWRNLEAASGCGLGFELAPLLALLALARRRRA